MAFGRHRTSLDAAQGHLRRWGGPLGLLLVTLALGLTGCAEAPRDTLNPAGDSAEVSAWFFYLFLVLDVVIFAIVGLGTTYALIRFRAKDGDDSLPEQNFGNMKLELLWTVIPAAIVFLLAIPTVAGIFKLAEAPDKNQKVIEVDVVGKQWWWEFDYRNEGIVTANEMHVEEGTQVALNLTSADVIHAFWIPRVSGKRDLTPGRQYPLYFRPNMLENGTTDAVEFEGQCAELCGPSHALMGLKLIVHPRTGPNSYNNWVAAQSQPARAPQTPEEEAGLKVFKTKGCTSCHTIHGVAELAPDARTAITGPNLTHVGSRTSILANTLDNTPENIAKWVKAPEEVKQGSRMPNLGLNDEEAKAVATYLTSLK